MPMDKTRYPADWDAISLRIRIRDGQRCTQCGAPNGALIYRHPDDKAKYAIISELFSWNNITQRWESDASLHPEKLTRVVLTVHHIGAPKPDGTPGDRHDKMDGRDENLTSPCHPKTPRYLQQPQPLTANCLTPSNTCTPASSPWNTKPAR